MRLSPRSTCGSPSALLVLLALGSLLPLTTAAPPFDSLFQRLTSATPPSRIRLLDYHPTSDATEWLSPTATTATTATTSLRPTRSTILAETLASIPDSPLTDVNRRQAEFLTSLTHYRALRPTPTNAEELQAAAERVWAPYQAELDDVLRIVKDGSTLRLQRPSAHGEEVRRIDAKLHLLENGLSLRARWLAGRVDVVAAMLKAGGQLSRAEEVERSVATLRNVAERSDTARSTSLWSRVRTTLLGGTTRPTKKEVGMQAYLARHNLATVPSYRQFGRTGQIDDLTRDLGVIQNTAAALEIHPTDERRVLDKLAVLVQASQKAGERTSLAVKGAQRAGSGTLSVGWGVKASAPVPKMLTGPEPKSLDVAAEVKALVALQTLLGRLDAVKDRFSTKQKGALVRGTTTLQNELSVRLAALAASPLDPSLERELTTLTSVSSRPTQLESSPLAAPPLPNAFGSGTTAIERGSINTARLPRKARTFGPSPLRSASTAEGETVPLFASA